MFCVNAMERVKVILLQDSQNTFNPLTLAISYNLSIARNLNIMGDIETTWSKKYF